MSSKEFVICSSRVFTGIPENPWAEAVGIKDGRIAAVGSDREVKSLLPRAESIELPGRLVAPGLVDGHCHFVGTARAGLMVDLNRLPSLEACRRKIRKAVSAAEPGEWVIGRGWNHHLWAEGRLPTRKDLDDISPHHPLMMIRVCRHSQWLNPRALELAGITRNSEAPDGIRYDRNGSGELTGLLHEARDIIQAVIPPPGPEKLKAAVLATQAEFLRVGLTGVHSCESLEEWKLLRELDREGLLRLRIHHLIQPHDLAEAEALGLTMFDGSPRLWIGHLKLFADGSLGSATALMHEPYDDEPANCGIHCLDAEGLKEQVLAGYRLGFSAAVHAIGDKAGTHALDAFAHARLRYPGPRRDRIEHVQLFRGEDLARYRDMGIVASVQPVFVCSDWQVAGNRWGSKRCGMAYAWKTLLDNGIPLQFGSDSPVENMNPVLGLQAAVLRQTPELEPEGGWYPDQRLTLEQSLTGFTRTAAWTSGKEDCLGSLAPGNRADLTVFDKDLDAIPAREWHGVGVEMTFVDGEIVHSRS